MQQSVMSGCSFSGRTGGAEVARGPDFTFQKGVNHPCKGEGTGLVAQSSCNIHRHQHDAGAYPFICAGGDYWVLARGCSAMAESENVSGEEADCKRHSGLQSHHSFEPMRRSNALRRLTAIMRAAAICL